MRAIGIVSAVVGVVLAVPGPVHAQVAAPDLVRSLQWQLESLKIADVHKKSTGAGITVAVVDSGVDPSHPDLTGQVLQGPEASNSDVDGRGTGLAGLIAGHGHSAPGASAVDPGDNGILGIAPSAKILPVAFAPGPGENGDADRMASAIEIAIARGAKVICIGRGAVPTERLQFAIEVAVDKGLLVVATDTTPWPGSYPGVFSAIPSNRFGVVQDPASGRTTGIAVPGVELMTTDRAGGYRIADSSGAAAVLAGAAAVVWSVNVDATAAQIAEVMRRTATEQNGVRSLNLLAALNAGVPKPTIAPSPSAVAPTPSSTRAVAVGNALVHSDDWRRWLVVLPLILFMAALAGWAYVAARRRAEVPAPRSGS